MCRRVRDPRLRGNVTDDDVDLRMAPQGDVDLRQLPFKPAPAHTPANEIDASITSHPPVPYKLIPFIVAPPDYSDITSKVCLTLIIYPLYVIPCKRLLLTYSNHFKEYLSIKRVV